MTAGEISKSIDIGTFEKFVFALHDLRKKGGRLFILGVGGSAGNASHATNDFRKLCGIETYCPTDNTSELTARTNDEGWETVFSDWLAVSNLSSNDCLLVFSVGGGNKEKNVSVNLIKAAEYANSKGAMILGIVGRDDGYIAKNGDLTLVVPSVSPERVTPHSESFQAVIWHGLVSHPKLQTKETKW